MFRPPQLGLGVQTRAPMENISHPKPDMVMPRVYISYSKHAMVMSCFLALMAGPPSPVLTSTGGNVNFQLAPQSK